MAFITIPVLITTVVAVNYIRKRNRERALMARPGRPVEELDASVVAATIVLSSLSPHLMEQTLEQLPPPMARSIVMVLPELPPIAKQTVEDEKKRWLSHFEPPRESFAGLETEDPRMLAAATIRLVLEDSN